MVGELLKTVLYNFAFAIGYTNSSWTLKVGLVCDHLCRMLAYMDGHGYTTVTPVADDPAMPRRPLLDFAAGYVQRTADLFPQQGSRGPWNVEMNYFADRKRYAADRSKTPRCASAPPFGRPTHRSSRRREHPGVHHPSKADVRASPRRRPR